VGIAIKTLLDGAAESGAVGDRVDHGLAGQAGLAGDEARAEAQFEIVQPVVERIVDVGQQFRTDPSRCRCRSIKGRPT
jgi:hypothetical protein